VYQALLMLFAMLVFSGCAAKCENRVVVKTVEVKVPVMKQAPKVDCNLSQESDEDVVVELYRCLYDTRQVCYAE
jgi:predicted component of type VI protein secretion system